MEEKKMVRHMFNHGKLAMLQRMSGYSTPASIRRIALSGGVGLDEQRQEIYDYMWKNKVQLFRPEFLKRFVKEHMTNAKLIES